MLSTQSVGIRKKEDRDALSITFGSYGVIESHPLNDESGRPVVIQNAMFARHMQISDPQVAPAGHRWSDPEMPLTFNTKAGALSTFNWSGS